MQGIIWETKKEILDKIRQRSKEEHSFALSSLRKPSTKKQERTFLAHSCFAVFVFTCKAFSFANDKLFQRTYRFSISSAVKPVFSAMTSTEIPACLRFFAISRCFCAAPSLRPFLRPMASPSLKCTPCQGHFKKKGFLNICQ